MTKPGLLKARLNKKDKYAFFLELSKLMGSGIGIIESLELMERRTKNLDRFEIIKDLSIGEDVSETIAYHLEISDDLKSILEIGESTNQMSLAFLRISEVYKDQIMLKKEIIKIISYPMIILCTAFMTCIFMLKFVVPMFYSVFSQMGSEIPSSTRFLIDISQSIDDILLITFINLLLLFFIYRHLKKRVNVSLFIIRIPILKRIIETRMRIYIASNLSYLLTAGYQLQSALEIVSKTSKMIILKKEIEFYLKEVLKGESLFKVMSQSRLWTRQDLSLIKISEESKQLDKCFSEIHETLKKEIENQGKMISIILEPLLLVVIGGIVAFVLISLYLPIFQMSSGMDI